MNNPQETADRRAALQPFMQTSVMYNNERFRKVQMVDPQHGSDDLTPFVTLSDGSDEIANAHEELHGAKRHALYERWYKSNPDAFLLLDKKNADNKWSPAAVSITLPLTAHAYQRVQDGQLAVIDLQDADILPKGTPAEHVLIDTWIVDPSQRKHLHMQEHRGWHGGSANALVLKHLGQFWDPSAKKPMHIMIEPDSPEIAKMAEALIGPRGPRPTKSGDGGTIYSVNASPEWIAADSHILGALADNVTRCRAMGTEIKR